MQFDLRTSNARSVVAAAVRQKGGDSQGSDDETPNVPCISTHERSIRRHSRLQVPASTYDLRALAGGCALKSEVQCVPQGDPRLSETMYRCSILCLVAFCTLFGCRSVGRTTWEQDRRDGVPAAVHFEGPTSPQPQGQKTRAWADSSAADPLEVAHELELALLQFSARRRAVSQSTPKKLWALSLLHTWNGVLGTLEAGFASTKEPLPTRLLIQARVTLEAEQELTERRHGPAPKDIHRRVRALWTTIAIQLRAQRPAPPANSGPEQMPGGFSWPVSPIVVTSPFGFRRDPILGARKVRFHAGLDLGGRRGDVISAAAAGNVVGAAWQGGHGRTVTIQHPQGLSTRYAHLSRILVSLGTRVEAGDAIALMGSTGRSTGPHLHFEVRKGSVPLDPFEVMRRHGQLAER